MAKFGNINAFDETEETWLLYVGRLNQFFLANDVELPEKKRAIFLTVVGPKTYKLLHTLVSPARLEDRTFTQLIDLLNAHFSPTPSEILERFKFNSRNRLRDESIATYIAELRRLAEFCNYANTLDMMLRDRLVCGINNTQIQTRLLGENNLTLERATQMATAMESATKDANDLRKVQACEKDFIKDEINKMHEKEKGYYLKNNTSKSHKHKWPEQKPKSSNKWQACKEGDKAKNFRECIRCGSQSHNPRNCPHIQSECYKCSKIGHLSHKCLSGNQAKYKVHEIDSSCKTIDKEIDDTFHALHEYELFQVSDCQELPPKPTIVNFRINGEQLDMELDTGAAYSVISEKSYQKFKLSTKLEPTETKLRSFTGHPIKIIGQLKVQVQVDNHKKTETLPLLVISGNCTNVCGRNWISRLGLVSTNINQTVNKTDNATLAKILDKHKEVFEPGMGTLRGVKIHLSIKPDAQPVFCKPRTVPYAMQDKVAEELGRLQEQGIIEPVRHSEWAAPIVPVLKHDKKSIRICGDFRLTLNPVSNTEKYPIPRAEDIFAKLAGGKRFSKIDLKEAYNQLVLDEDSRKLVVINTHKGLFQYTRLPYGVSSASAIFQREAEILVQGIEGASAFQDDILVTGIDDNDHLQNLDETLKRISEAGLKVKLEKCDFFSESVTFLGHRLDAAGLHTDTNKIAAIVQAPIPENVSQLRSFIGMITYYAKFLKHISTVMAPLHSLLGKNVEWKWNDDANRAFKEVKEMLVSSSLLIHFDPNKTITLATDASPYGLGAVISHEINGTDQPIAFASRTLTPAEKNYSHLEKEALAIIFGITRFRDYLFGKHFILLTDHRPLITLFSEKKGVPCMAAARVQRWALTLGGFNYTIKYRKGDLNGNADALSRLPLQKSHHEPPSPPEVVLLLESYEHQPITAEMVKEETMQDQILSKVMQKIQASWHSENDKCMMPFWNKRDELSVEQGLILRGNRVIIPSKLRPGMLQELHKAHQGMVAMKSLARSKMWWPGIDDEIENIVRRCTTCQEQSAMPAKQESIPWPTVPIVWHRIHIDYAGPVEGKMLLIVVDAHSKWLEVVPVSAANSTNTITELSQIFARLGNPVCLISDNGTPFSSSEFEAFMKFNGIKHLRIAPYHPASNGLAERAVRVIKTSLNKITTDSLTKRIATALMAYRSTPIRKTGMSPAEMLLGRKIRTRLDLIGPAVVYNNNDLNKRIKRFKIHDNVWVRNFGSGAKWIPGTISQCCGRIMYAVTTTKGVLKKHENQLRSRINDGKAITSDASSVVDYGWFIDPDQVMRPHPTRVSTERPITDNVETVPSVRRSTRFRTIPVRLDL